MKTSAGLAAVFCLAGLAAPGRASDTSLIWLPNCHVQYEGLGYRAATQGWDIKSKPSGTGLGWLWRHAASERLAVHVQYWRNEPFYSREDGNAAGASVRQSGQARIALQALLADVRTPLAGSSVEFAAGVLGVHETIRRKDVFYGAVPESGGAEERLQGAGLHMGFHRPASPAPGFSWEGEALLGHLFLTRNRLRIQGGSIRRDGYTYHLRLGAVWRRGRWRVGAGFVRQMFQIMVPGGKLMPGGAAASFPINKTDFSSPFLSAGFVY